MRISKHRNQGISGDDESTLPWTNESAKEELIVEVLTTDDLFAALSVYWEDLVDRAAQSECISHQWAWNWWNHFGKNKQRELSLITVWDGTKIVALAPFFKADAKVSSGLSERRLELIGSGSSKEAKDDSEFLDILVDEAYSELVSEKLIDIFTPDYLDADAIKIHQTGQNSFVINYLYPKLKHLEYDLTLNQAPASIYIGMRP